VSKDSSGNKLVYSTGAGDLRKAEKNAPKLPGEASANQQKVRVVLDTKGRRGKAVTIIAGIQHNPQVIEKLSKELKNLCGAGGTVEDGNILIQGDHREKVTAKLRTLGYQV
jgi:translation initiation factor 1